MAFRWLDGWCLHINTLLREKHSYVVDILRYSKVMHFDHRSTLHVGYALSLATLMATVGHLFAPCALAHGALFI